MSLNILLNMQLNKKKQKSKTKFVATSPSHLLSTTLLFLAIKLGFVFFWGGDYSLSTNNQAWSQIMKHRYAYKRIPTLENITSTLCAMCSNLAHRQRIKQTVLFYVQSLWCRSVKHSTHDLFNTSPIHINLVGMTGRCGRDELAVTVLQGWMLWVLGVGVYMWRGRCTAAISFTSEWIPSADW